MGLHLVWELAAPAGADPAEPLGALREVALWLPFAEVTALERGVAGDGVHAPFGASVHLPFDDVGTLHPRDWEGDTRSLRTLSVQPLEWAAFRVWPGQGCETATFGLARHPATALLDGLPVPTWLADGWRWHTVCKTQHASAVSWEHFMTVHGSLVSLLDVAEGLGIVHAVRDETHFLPDRDWARAAAEVRSMNEMIGRVGDALRRALDDAEPPDERDA